MKVLFLTKINTNYDFVSYTRKSSGLWNSTRFIVESLCARGVHAKIEEIVDNNSIDREVHKFKPDMVVIEALFVVPEKFDVLKKLHPTVKWFVHLHSHIPFLSQEGIAFNWLPEYQRRDVVMIANSGPSYRALQTILDPDHLIYLPNVYLMKPSRDVKLLLEHKRFTHEHSRLTSTIDIGCFGAVRPLKNQVLRALAAIRFAREIGKELRFHINGTRSETGGDPVRKNLRELFGAMEIADEGHVLVEHAWHEPEDFIRQLEMKIDIGMQVSLTETFNVVTADYVTAGVPVVVSKEVYWTSKFSQVKDDEIDEIVSGLHFAHGNHLLVRWNQFLLQQHTNKAQKMWYEFVRSSGNEVIRVS